MIVDAKEVSHIPPLRHQHYSPRQRGTWPMTGCKASCMSRDIQHIARNQKNQTLKSAAGSAMKCHDVKQSI